MQQPGMILALCSAVAWGIWGVCSKLSTNHGVPAASLAFVSSCASFVIITLTYLGQRTPGTLPLPGLLFALGSGVAGSIGVLLFSFAIKQGNAAIIVALTAVYPAFTAVLGAIVLHETLSLAHIAGVTLIILGITLVAR